MWYGPVIATVALLYFKEIIVSQLKGFNWLCPVSHKKKQFPDCTACHIFQLRIGSTWFFYASAVAFPRVDSCEKKIRWLHVGAGDRKYSYVLKL